MSQQTQPTPTYKLLRKVKLPFGVDGPWRVAPMPVSKEDSKLGAIGMKFGRWVPPGDYTALYRGGTLVMSDTPDELRDHTQPVREAKGHVLIAGLGLGCVLQAILDKDGVEKVTAIERSAEVIRLVAPTYLKRYKKRFEIIHADIREWRPPEDAHYCAAWFDIWNELCTDNLKEMSKLRRRFKRHATWIGSWGEDPLRVQKRREGRVSRTWRML